MPPGSAKPSSRAATLTPSPVDVLALDDHVAQVDTDAELDAPPLGGARVAPRHRALHLDRTLNGIDDACELGQDAIAGGLDDAPVVRGDGGLDQLAEVRLHGRQRGRFVLPHETRVADHVGRQDRRQPARIARLFHVRLRGNLSRAESTRGDGLSPREPTPGGGSGEPAIGDAVRTLGALAQPSAGGRPRNRRGCPSNHSTRLSPSNASMWVAIRSRNQRSWLMTITEPAKRVSASSSARRVSTSRSLVGSSRSRRLAPSFRVLARCTRLRFATRQRPNLLLLVGAAEVEGRAVGATLDLARAERDFIEPPRDLLPHRVGRVEPGGAIDRRGRAPRSRPAATCRRRRFDPQDHPEECRFCRRRCRR